MTLSSLELSQLRSDAGDYLPDTCTIQVPTNSRTTEGGFTTSYANTYTSVACRLAPMQAGQMETMEGHQITSLTRWVMTVAYNQTLAEGYRVVHSSETYEVEHLEDTHSNRTAKRVYLRRLD